MKEMKLFIPRIPLHDMDMCAHATIESAARAFNITHITQSGLHVHVTDPSWGTEPLELVEMSKEFLPNTHILAREKWKFEDVDKLLSDSRVVMVLDVTDCLDRYDKVLKKKVDTVDGHYVILSKLVNIEKNKYALIIDPSKDEIVLSGNYGVITTSQENVYFIPLDILDKIWVDENKDGSLNDHWALVMLHPEDNPEVLDQFRK